MLWLLNKNDCHSNARLDGKTAIVTGSNSGIGKVTAKDFYKRGCRVIMACRNIKSAEEARKEIIDEVGSWPGTGEIVIRQLNLASFAEIRKFAQIVLEEEKQIHILVNNAGYGGTPFKTMDKIDLVMSTNYYGPFLLTLLLLPRMIKTGSARIVNVSSLLYALGTLDFDDLTMTKSYWSGDPYSASKVALMLFSTELAKRLKGTGVTVYSLHPGLIKTQIWYNNVSPILRIFVYILFWLFFITAEKGAQTQIRCAVDEDLKNESGHFYIDCKAAYVFPHARNPEKAARLWAESWKTVELGDYDPFVPK